MARSSPARAWSSFHVHCHGLLPALSSRTARRMRTRHGVVVFARTFKSLVTCSPCWCRDLAGPRCLRIRAFREQKWPAMHHYSGMPAACTICVEDRAIACPVPRGRVGRCRVASLARLSSHQVQHLSSGRETGLGRLMLARHVSDCLMACNRRALQVFSQVTSRVVGECSPAGVIASGAERLWAWRSRCARNRECIQVAHVCRRQSLC